MRDELIRESARTADAVQRADHFEKRLDAANSLGKAAREELAQAKARIAELEKDAARLDWLSKAGPVSIELVADRPHDGQMEVATDYAAGYGSTLRAAIDAAMAKGE